METARDIWSGEPKIARPFFRYARMFLALFLSSFVSCAQAGEPVFLDPAMDPARNCYLNYLESSGVNQLSLISKSINKALFIDWFVDGSTKITAWEKKVLKKHPAIGIYLGNARCRAIAITSAGCGVKLGEPGAAASMQNEEADAIRHFVFTFMLAAKHGPELAKLYVTAHEGRPEFWGDPAFLDIANNEAAISDYREIFGERKGMKVSDEVLLGLALTALKDGRIKGARVSTTRCGKEEVFQADPRELLRSIRQTYHQLKTVHTTCKLPFWVF